MSFRLKLAILGTRGIPNRFGGFEQFAEFLSVNLAQRNYDVTVFCHADHPAKQSTYSGVRLQYVTTGRSLFGSLAEPLYDARCFRQALQERYDVYLQLGYTWTLFPPQGLGRDSVVVTNMDGMEWQRSKWGTLTRRLLRHLEAKAVRRSTALVADSRAIKSYLDARYGVDATYIPYPGDATAPQPESPQEAFSLAPRSYDLIIARMEPENSIETILLGKQSASTGKTLVVVGDVSGEFGASMKQRFEASGVRFLGPVFDRAKLDGLRRDCSLYFHGHSVGGTNPSLLEAMAAGAMVTAHDNSFNREVLGDAGRYFSTSADVAKAIEFPLLSETERSRRAEAAKRRLRQDYDATSIVDRYDALFCRLVGKKSDEGPTFLRKTS